MSDDHGVWFPPPEPMPQGPVAGQPFAPPPPPYLAPALPVAAPIKSAHMVLIVIGSILVGFALFAGAVIALLPLVVRPLAADMPPTSNPYVPPSGCETRCLTTDDVSGLVPDAEDLAVLGSLSPDPANGYPVPTSTADIWNDATLDYRASGGDPAVCYFTRSDAPLSRDALGYFDTDLSTVRLGTFANAAGTTLTETARLYDAELIAGRYLGSIRSPIIQCASFSYNDGTAVRQVSLLPVAFNTGSDAVASASWVETWGDQRRLVANLQYANLTMRVALQQGPEASVTDEQFAQYVTSVAARMTAAG